MCAEEVNNSLYRAYRDEKSRSHRLAELDLHLQVLQQLPHQLQKLQFLYNHIIKQ